MSKDSKQLGEPRRGAQAGSSGTAGSPGPAAAADDATLGAIGYEAADPSLQSPFWSEAPAAAEPSTTHPR